VTQTPYGAVLATIPATVDAPVPTIALLAHVDTAPQFPGKDVKPIVHRSFGGEDIVLPDDPEQVLSSKALPYLAQKVGDDIVTASGKTLLGADDKAGIAIIMAVARHLLQAPGLAHGKIRIGFTSLPENCGAVSTCASSAMVGTGASTVAGIVASTAPYGVCVTSRAPISFSSSTSRLSRSNWFCELGDVDDEGSAVVSICA
jgi:hypothetical protein